MQRLTSKHFGYIEYIKYMTEDDSVRDYFISHDFYFGLKVK